MPFFDFKCEKCGHQFNIRVSNADKDKVKCPECESPKVRQLLSPFFAPGSKLGVAGGGEMPGGCCGCPHAGSGCGF